MITAAAVRGQLADIAERAAKTAAQVLLAYFAVGQLDAFHADWGKALSLAAGAAILSVLSSLASLPMGQPGTASATSSVVPAVGLNVYQAAATYGDRSAQLKETP
jgi:hypothetical protein